jgi:CRISPR-associated protein Csd1
MLELLVEYARSRGLEIEPGFKPKDVRWAICFDEGGAFLDVVELGDVQNKRNKGRTFNKCPDLTQSEMVSGSGTKSHFLVETASVLCLLVPKGEPDAKSVTKHEYFVGLLREASTAMPEIARAADLLSTDETLEQIRSSLFEQKAKPTDKVTIRIGDRFPVECPEYHAWWRARRWEILRADGAARRKEKKPLEMVCLVTGESSEPAATHPKIEGLAGVGGQPSGDVLVGFDKDAFQSYGLKQSANAPITLEAAYAYCAGLNHLIKAHGQRLAGTEVIYWFKESVPPENDPLSWFIEGQIREELNAEEWARRLMDSIRAGQQVGLAGNHYYAATLSGAGGRVMLRDWMEGKFDELVENVRSWFEDLAIIHREGNRRAASPKFYAVLGSTVRDLDDLAPPFVAKMWRAAIRGEPIPETALAKVLGRIRSDVIRGEALNHAGMGLMKAYHVRKSRKIGGGNMDIDLKPDLNEETPNPAYQCGRLMAVLADVQRRALGDVGAGVVQRYYAAASSTPSLVLGRLTRTSQFHLNKLDPGLAHWYEDTISTIWSGFKDELPRTLTLEEQSLFALGYYQQMAAMRKKKSPKNETEKEAYDE